MSTIEILALCAMFGAICAKYITVVGFTLTATMIIAVVAAAPLLLNSGFTVWTLVGAFVALQVGYFVGLVTIALYRHFSRLYSKDPSRVENGKLHIHHD